MKVTAIWICAVCMLIAANVQGQELTTLSNRCPLVLTEHAVFLPDDQDCRKYYVCLNGVAHPEYCPNSLYYDEASQRCDYADRALCRARPHLSPTPPRIRYDPDPLDCHRYYTCKLEHCGPSEYWSTIHRSCMQESDGSCHSDNIVTLKPDIDYSAICQNPLVNYASHPGDCSNFIQCSNGAAYVMACPEGLFWNAVEQNCDFVCKTA